jgi:hypothetical protein
VESCTLHAAMIYATLFPGRLNIRYIFVSQLKHGNFTMVLSAYVAFLQRHTLDAAQRGAQLLRLVVH